MLKFEFCLVSKSVSEMCQIYAGKTYLLILVANFENIFHFGPDFEIIFNFGPKNQCFSTLNQAIRTQSIGHASVDFLKKMKGSSKDPILSGTPP